MSTIAVTLRRAILLTAVVAVAGCGSGDRAGSGGTGSGRVQPSGAASGPVTSRPSGSLPAFSGTATVLIEVDGTSHEIIGGRCDQNEYPADMGGGWVFSLNAGTLSFGDGGPDYLGINVELADPAAPDGEYSGGSVLATASVGGSGFNVGDTVVTIRDNGTAGSFTGETRPDNKPVRGTFSC